MRVGFEVALGSAKDRFFNPSQGDDQRFAISIGCDVGLSHHVDSRHVDSHFAGRVLNVGLPSLNLPPRVKFGLLCRR